MLKKVFKIIQILFILALFFQFSESKAEENELLPFRENSKWGFIDLKGNRIVEPEYEAIGYRNSNGLIPVMKNGQTNLINIYGQKVLENIHTGPGTFVNLNNYLFLHKPENGLSSLFNYKGDELMKNSIKEIIFLSNDSLLIFQTETGKGLMDNKGQIILNAIYSDISKSATFSNYFVIKSGYYFGISDRNGEILIQTEYSNLDFQGSKWIVVKEKNRKKIYNLDQNRFLDKSWEDISYLASDYFKVKVKKGYVVLDANNEKILFKIEFDDIAYFSNRYFLIYDKNFSGLIDIEGNIVLETVYLNIEFRRPCHLLLLRENKYALADSNGNLLTQARYSNIGFFQENGLAIVRENGIAGVINLNGEIILPCYYEHIYISDNIIRAESGSNIAFSEIDANGNILQTHSYQNIPSLNIRGTGRMNNVRSSNNIRTISVNNGEFSWVFNNQLRLWGLQRNSDMQMIIPFRFNDVRVSDNREYTVIKEESDQYISNLFNLFNFKYTHLEGLVDNSNGNILLEPKFLKIFINDLTDGVNSSMRAILPNGKLIMTDLLGISTQKYYLFIDSFTNGYTRALKEGRFIRYSENDERLKIIVKTEYINIIPLWFRRDNRFQLTVENNSYSTLICKSCKWVIIGPDGLETSPKEFEFIDEIEMDAAIVLENGKWNLVDLNGEFIIEYNFDNLERINFPNSDQPVYKGVYKKRKYGFISDDFSTITPAIFDAIKDFSEGLAAVKIDDKWGFVDKKGEIIIEPQFNSTGHFSEGLASVQIGRRWGYIDKSANLIIEAEYISAGEFGSGLAPVRTRRGFIYINSQGDQVIDQYFQRATPFKNGRAIVNTGRGLSVINTKGKVLTNNIYSQIENYNEYGVAVARKKGKLYLLNLNGNEINQFGFRKITGMEDNLIFYSNRLLNGVIDYEGKRLFRTPYRLLPTASEGKIPFRKKFLWGFKNLDGKTIVSPKYYNINGFNEEFANVVYKGGIHAFINYDDSIHIELERRLLAHPFSNGFARITERRKVHFIDTEGEMILNKMIFEDAYDFYEKCAVVKISGFWGIINSSALWQVFPRYDHIKEFKDGIAVYKISETYVLLDKKGYVIKAEIDNVKKINRKALLIERGGEMGYLDHELNWIKTLKD